MASCSWFLFGLTIDITFLLTVNNLPPRFCCESEHCAKSPKIVYNKVARRVRWEKPNNGWVRLNSDGYSLGNPGPASSGGLIRNDTGEWISRYARKYELQTAL